ncbi:MAG: Type 1 glutamine amidotransferase-like domain-containing protein, partial [Bacteroidales bacterium]|nr:Type 1 glutamine amidotransferase-like domain-containing protein [Bacteroidales bacterium]
MTLILTGSPTRYGEDRFTTDNDFLAAVKALLPEAPRVLLVSAAPDDRAFTDSVLDGMSLCIRNSGITPACVTMLDRRNAPLAPSLVSSADWVILCGGHVPTQNRFIHEIGLRELLKGFGGLVMGCSAGSMNCAELVYSHPELPGEAVDPKYRRWFPGLGLTRLQIVPHYYQVRDVVTDGRRLFEDVIFPDSLNHSFYTFPDGGYILVRDGRSTLHGTAWEISNGQMRQICSENKVYTFMNVVFISPHFPQTYSHFCAGLKANGVNVLGIADAPYGELTDELRGALTDYYQVRNLEDYDEVYRAVAWFAHRYGHIDWIESNNEYWLEQDARLRTDFNVSTGLHSDRISGIKNKSEMKKFYALGGVPTARQIKAAEGLKAVQAFTRKTGFPIIAKPDNGVGAGGTFKIHSDSELQEWFKAHEADYGSFVIEEFITGLLVSYDAIFNLDGKPVFENNTVFPTPIMDIVHNNLDTCYWTNRDVPAALAKIGRRTVAAFGVAGRFVHLEFFQLDRDREGLGKKGDYVGLEVNMRPPGGYTPDMMNYAHSTDVFQIWADMVAFGERRKGAGEQYFCAYASRRDCHTYAHSHEDILSRYGAGAWAPADPALGICMCRRVPDALSDDLGNQAYMARFSSRKD